MLHKDSYLIILTVLIFTSVLTGCASGSNNSIPKLRILVTNDDGFDAKGIDAIVQALTADPDNKVIVCAPVENKSGSGSNTDCGTLETVEEETLGGHPVIAIDGCPSDAVNYAFKNLYTSEEKPHLVISGINSGQNVSVPVTELSGTIGAAKTAARSGIRALASSQGHYHEGSQFDFPSGTTAVLLWLAGNRAALVSDDTTPAEVTSMNIPSCDKGSIRGILAGVPISSSSDNSVSLQDCESILDNPANDVEALNNGYITQSSIPLD